MASIYKNNNTWYLSVTVGKRRVSRSLKTNDYKVAKKLKPHVESLLIAELSGFRNYSEKLEFPELVTRFLKAEHGWVKNTYDLYNLVLRKHLNGEPLPTNTTSRAIHIRHINACWNWGLKNKLIDKHIRSLGIRKVNLV